MAIQYTPGSFAPAGWRIDAQPTPPPYTPWLSFVPSPYSADLATASNLGGFSFVYDGTPTPLSRSITKNLPIALPDNLPVNIANTGYTDVLQGSAGTYDYFFGPDVGINLGRQTVLALGPAAALIGNQLNGYGTWVGVQIGDPTLNGESKFEVSYASGVVLGGKGDVADTVLGTAYGSDASGIENYGEILLDGGTDRVYGFADTSGFGGIGLINWGVISTGGESKKDLADSITGTGLDCGIYNSTGSVDAVTAPTIFTGAGADVIWGQAKSGNAGIFNDGLIDMGSGDDTYKSTLFFGTATTSAFGGTGTVVMGSGNDNVQGFGTGTFYGDGLGEVVLAKVKGKTLTNYDSLYVIDGTIYTVTATSTTGRSGQTINGFNITSGGVTMTVYGFEAIGTSSGNLTTLAEGTYDYLPPA
jgi:hypothetical protein